MHEPINSGHLRALPRTITKAARASIELPQLIDGFLLPPAFDDLSKKLARGYLRWCYSMERTPRTIMTYGEVIKRFARFLAAQDLPRDFLLITPETITSYLVSMREASLKPSTLATNYRGLRAFYAWLEREEEITRTPFAKLREPHIPDIPVDVLTEPELKALFKVTGGPSFNDRRDHALLRLLLDTGLRLTEMLNLKTADVDTDRDILTINGKGAKFRLVRYNHKAALALARYNRVRVEHRHAGLPWLWLSQRGVLATSSVAEMLAARSVQAGIPKIHAHQFRHTWAHLWRAGGGSEGDLMMLGGWSTPLMLRRYGQSVAVERALEAARTFAPGDRF